jgi:hypothetical protein
VAAVRFEGGEDLGGEDLGEEFYSSCQKPVFVW